LSNLSEGQFVEAQGHFVGFGKLVNIQADLGEVELFHSQVQQERRKLPLSELKRARPGAGTRCYTRRGDGWTKGRIARWNGNELEFRGPDLCEWMSESDVSVRTCARREDPLAVLLQHGQETPLYHNGRYPFMAELIRQRAACRGMTAALSAGIELYEHQISAAIRVLSDPVQRYLLADEVGIGKTIEAGIVIRQFLLDEPSGKVLVLVPESLTTQWRQELTQKFRVNEHPGRVEVESFGSKAIGSTPTMLVVDEAHQVAAGAFDQDAIARKRFEEVSGLAQKAERVILLSATPLLHHERDYLAMLHLLDPVAYPLDATEAFDSRIQKRQHIGKLLLAMQDDMPLVVIVAAAKELAEACHGDQRLQDLVEKMRTAPDDDGAIEVLRELRAHVGEVHRLYRRMIRYRRIDMEHSLQHGRLVRESEHFDDDANLDEYSRVAEFDADDGAEYRNDPLEQWRLAALEHALRHPDTRDHLVGAYVALLECAATGKLSLELFAQARRHGVVPPELQEFLGPRQTEALVHAARFPAEGEILEGVVASQEKETRAELATEVTLNALRDLDKRKQPKKVIVFAGFAPLAAQITKLLRNELGKPGDELGELAVATLKSGMNSMSSGEQVRRFQSEAACRVIVCDRTGEDGHNLQVGACVVHAELPWNPGRIEQRMGRIDRIGQTGEVTVKMLVGAEDGPLDAWAWVLVNGFGVFHGSIASTQLFAEGEGRRLAGLLFDEGPQRLKSEVDAVRKGIAEELQRVEEQAILDQQDIGDFSEVFASLDGDEHDVNRTDESRQAIEQWMCKTLRVDRIEQEDASGVKYNFRRALLPEHLRIRLHFAATQLRTYSRRAACRPPEPRLLRLGDPLIDTLHEQILTEDRGQVFAMWRCDPKWSTEHGAEWLGFRFDFIIEADAQTVVDQLRQALNRRISTKVVQRLLDRVFPPRITSLLTTDNGTEVQDSRLRRVLQQPYCKVSDGGWDINVDAERRHILESVVGSQRWETMCEGARAVAEQSVKGDPKLATDCNAAVNRARRMHAERLAAIRVRAANYGGHEADLQLEECLAAAVSDAVQAPAVRLDAVGFFIVSGREPEGWRDE
jgi:ATP-dependent helicase HepA